MRQLKIVRQFTNRDSESLDLYLNEISKLSMITIEDEVILARKIKSGDRKALEILINANLRFVISVAKQYQNQGLVLPDLINEGNLGLIKAAERFDETRGFRFISYAVWWIRQSILQAIAEQSRIVRLPMNKIGSITKINKAFTKLEQDYQREPIPEEIAKMLKLHAEIVEEALQASNFHVSLDAPIWESDHNENTLYDSLISNDVQIPDILLINKSLEIEIERALHSLTDREAEILRHYFGFIGDYPKTVDEIAAIFGIKHEMVRKIKDKALKKLRNINRNRLLRPFLG